MLIIDLIYGVKVRKYLQEGVPMPDGGEITMTDTNTTQHVQETELDGEKTPVAEEHESPYEQYGWEFHKIPLLLAAVVTVLMYAFIFFYVNR